MSNVADVKRRVITLDLDKRRELKYTLNSFAEMEECYGSVDAALDAVNTGSIKAVRFMIWAGLIHEDESLTEKQVGNLIQIQDMEQLTNKLLEALDGDSPSSEQKQDANSIISNTTSPNA